MLVIQEDTDLNSLPKGLLVTREIKKREISRREKGEKSSFSLAWYRQKREKREKIGMDPHIYSSLLMCEESPEKSLI
jgi:hypothetical protein